MAFDRDTRNKLSAFVHQCRRLLCGEYNQPGGEIARLLAHYGIQVTGEVTEVAQLPHLDEAGRDTARLLREILAFKRANTPQTRIWRKYDPAVYDLLQEQAFTVLNRLCALRMAEAREIILPCVSEKTQSQGFQLYEFQSGKADDQGTRYRHFLFSVFDELALDLPALFDRFSPQGLLFPGHGCIESLLDAINAEEINSLWAEDETIGWIYQYWNSQEERKAMRDASAAPRNSRELAVRNQFFTPRYVVEFLTDNTLGRIWYEMCQGQTRLKEECRYLVRRPTEIFLGPGESAPEQKAEENLSQEELLKQPVYIPHRPIKDPREIRLLDPACGSMHFGLYAFELFEKIYEEYWERSEGVPPSKQRNEGVPPSTLSSSLKKEGKMPSLRSENEGETPALPFLNPHEDIAKRRTHLPHWEQDGVTYFLTWRLADSLPKEKLDAWKAERDAWVQAHPQPWDPETEDQYHRKFSDRLDDYLDAGAGRCLLKDPALGSLVADALRHFHGERYLLDSFVVMPNHVHVLVRLENEESLAKVLHSWKSYTAKEINRQLGESGTVWQEDYFDRIIRNERHLAATHRYIEDNPRKARLPEGSFQRSLQRSEGVPPSKQRNEGILPSISTDELKNEGGTPSLRSLYPSKEAFLRDVPKLIIEHNIHGVDIDPRAAQIAGLSLWLMAQKIWKRSGVESQDRPQIMRSNVVCAEPMPGDVEQLRVFCESLNQPAIGGLVEHIFEKMELAGEAGTLLKIEEEITEIVATAKKDWLKAPKLKQAELFQTEDLPAEKPQSELGLDFSGITDEAFWDKAEERIYTALEEYAKSAESGDYQRRLFAKDAAHGFAFIDLCRKRYDSVVMNPPFGEASKVLAKHLGQNFPTWNNNVLCAFIEANISLASPHGRIASVIDRSLINKSSYEKFRRQVLLKDDHLDHVAELGWEVLDANVEVSSIILANSPSILTRFIDVRGFLLEDKPSELLGEENDSEKAKTFLHRTKVFPDLPNAALIYNLPEQLLAAFSIRENLSELGLKSYTGHQLQAERHFRVYWEIDPREKLSPTSDFCLMYNGGGFSRYLMPPRDIARFGDYSSFGSENFPSYSYRVQNKTLHFKKGVGFGERGDVLDAHLIPPNMLFTVEGQVCPLTRRATQLQMLAILNSSTASRIINTYAGQHKYSGYVNLLPLVPISDDDKCVESLVEVIVGEKYRIFSLDETCITFLAPAWAIVRDPNRSISVVAKTVWDDVDQSIQKVRHAHQHLEIVIQNSYAGNSSEAFDDLEAYKGSTPLESIAGWEDRDRESSESYIAESVVSYSIASSLGRWDIRYATGERQQPELPDPFDPLPVCPPGMLQGEDGLPLEKDALRRMNDEGSYPLRVTVDGILVDDANDPEDIVARVREALRVIWGERATAIEQEAVEILQGKGRTPRDLRDYFRTPAQFFASHLARYSKSRRKAPIYWPISTASGDYTLWLYYHRLDDQTLLRCVNRIKAKVENVARERSRLANESSRSAAQDSELKRLATFEEELLALQTSLEAISKYWKPNLNDGVQITAAPLWEHFNHKPWQKALKDTWQKLEHGDYDWAHLAHSIWPERVVPKCAKDRSLAIAHGHEARLWHEVEVETGTGKKKKKKLQWQPVPNAEEVVAEILEELTNNGK